MYTLIPIGLIESSDRFLIHVDEPYRKGLIGLEDFKHIHVLWWFHLFDNEKDRMQLIAHPPHKAIPDSLGVFATRSPFRPNPIALTIVEVLSMDTKKGIIEVDHIEAEHGSPLLDLKPYHPSSDRIRDYGTPEWVSHWPKWYEDSKTYDWDREFDREG